MNEEYNFNLKYSGLSEVLSKFPTSNIRNIYIFTWNYSRKITSATGFLFSYLKHWKHFKN